MTKKRKNNSSDISETNFKKLSIQVSLNGLSFCVSDTVSQELVLSDSINFLEECNPEEMLVRLKELFALHKITEKQFAEVSVIHRNILFGLVPKPLFDPNSLSDYLRFSTKLFSSDVLEYDELEHQDMVNVYVPFTNVNNFIYDLFGEFTFFHDGTIIITSILNSVDTTERPVCYVHVSKRQLDICVVADKKLILYNSFSYETKEDFVYYILFVIEQLGFDTQQAKVKFFGAIEEDDDCYILSVNYISNLMIFIPSSPHHLPLGHLNENRIDFTVLNSL